MMPGWYRDLSNADYHASQGVSSSRLKMLASKTPAHMIHAMSEPSESTPAQSLGSAVHTMVLEPECVDRDIAVAPEINRRTKAGKEEYAAFQVESAGKIILSPEQWDTAIKMRDSILAHPMASIFLEDIYAEHSIYWDRDITAEHSELLKVRPDGICLSHPVLLDIKTCRDGSYTGFTRAVQNFEYHLSAAMYLEGVNQCSELMGSLPFNKYTSFLFICVENEAPFATSVYDLSSEYLRFGQALYERTLLALAQGRENDWPGYPVEIRTIEPPPWALNFNIV
jgi:hypothetical protein